MLGEVIVDPHGVEAGGRHNGLGLLPAVTTFGGTKEVHRTRASGLVDGRVLAVYVQGLCEDYVQGLCEDPRVLRALVGAEPPRSLDVVLDGLADLADRYLDMQAVLAVVQGTGRDAR